MPQLQWPTRILASPRRHEELRYDGRQWSVTGGRSVETLDAASVRARFGDEPFRRVEAYESGKPRHSHPDRCCSSVAVRSEPRWKQLGSRLRTPIGTSSCAARQRCCVWNQTVTDGCGFFIEGTARWSAAAPISGLQRLSSSRWRKVADAAGAFKDKAVILHLSVPEGTPAKWVESVSAFGGSERELLLGRGQSWDATRAVVIDGQWHVFGRVVGDS